MKKINICVGMFLLCVSSFAGEINIGKPENQVKKSKEVKAENLEYACCTRSATVSVSDGRGNVTSVTRTEEACVNNGESAAATMATACAAAQNAANNAALLSLSLILQG